MVLRRLVRVIEEAISYILLSDALTLFLAFKTSSPTQARIKKIMQVDNEIGKVALATPILICKCRDRRELRI